jgi:predicted amidophosphoribosyltransferase
MPRAEHATPSPFDYGRCYSCEAPSPDRTGVCPRCAEADAEICPVCGEPGRWWHYRCDQDDAGDLLDERAGVEGK